MNLKLIDLFNISLPGKITNLTLENTNNEFITLFYNNKTLVNEHIYEYHIYPPKYNKTCLELFPSQLKILYLNLDDLFQRKTNTNYYITLDKIYPEYGMIYINDELIETEKYKKLLKIEGNNLTFIFYNYKTINNMEIKHHISIDETYASENSIYLLIKSCYHSCKNCSEEIPDDTHHFCLACNEEEDYYPFFSPDSLNNCYNKKDMDSKKIPYYLEQVQKIFYSCHENCYNCAAGFNSLTDNMNCILCKDSFYKLNGTNNCYNRTLLNESYYFKDNMFFHCDDNCLTCSDGRNETSNNCLSCDINKELYLVEKLNNCEYKNYSGYYLDYITLKLVKKLVSKDKTIFIKGIFYLNYKEMKLK